MKLLILFLLVVNTPNIASAKINVLTTTTTLESITKIIGGDKISVDSITKGPQDPHFVEAKPSYMVKARNADLLILIGLDLEVGWITNIIRGSRNSKIKPGSTGYLDSSTLINPMSPHSGPLDRSHGDIHPFGNPHFLLDPLRAIKVAAGISARLSKIDPSNEGYYKKNSKEFSKLITSKLAKWKKRVKDNGIEKIITYHKTFNYFLKIFNIDLVDTIEPKPGVPPSAKHILSLIKKVKNKKIKCIFVESFFEPGAAIRVKKSAPVNIIIVPTEVLAIKTATTYLNLIEQLILSIELCNPTKD